MPYVDGFLLAVPTDKLDAYKAVAELAGAVWKEYGALSYVECIADDVPYGELTSFPRAVQKKTTKRWSSLGLPMSRARRAMRSTRR